MASGADALAMRRLRAQTTLASSRFGRSQPTTTDTLALMGEYKTELESETYSLRWVVLVSGSSQQPWLFRQGLVNVHDVLALRVKIAVHNITMRVNAGKRD